MPSSLNFEKMKKLGGRSFTELLNNGALEIKENLNDMEVKEHFFSAALFLFPSLSEGFGFPLLEAMATDTPIICSDTASCPEVAGDAAFYVDPENHQELAYAIESLLHNAGIREALIKNGRRRLSAYDWGKTADAILSLYKKVLPANRK